MVPVWPNGSRKVGKLQFSNHSIINYMFGFSVAGASFTCKKCFLPFGQSQLWLEANLKHLKTI